MKILVIGEAGQFEECRRKFSMHDCVYVPDAATGEKMLTQYDVIFDFLVAGEAKAFALCAGRPTTVFINTCNITLAELAQTTPALPECKVFGFNGFPTLFNRESLEISLLDPGDLTHLKNVCAQLNTNYLTVDDRVGMVTARVISMVINEAYFTVQEGTASREDIDRAMKLGTNYPFGPFEWCERIGLQSVYELLERLYDDTKDERYRISALMKKEYLRELPRGPARS